MRVAPTYNGPSPSGSPKPSMRLRSSLLVLPAISLVAYAHAADPKAARYYEDALKRYEMQDLNGTIIQLKNAIQIDRNMLAAQLLMGKVALANGDLPTAEAAFEEALRLGVSRAEVSIPLGQAYLLQGKFDTLLERISAVGLPATTQSEVLLLRANALANKGNRQASLRMLEEALAVDAKSVNARLALAMVHIQAGDFQRARAFVDEANKLAPNDAGALTMTASIAHARGDLAGALEAYGKAIERGPKLIDARVARAALLIDLGRLDEADRDLTESLQLVPNEPRASYLRSLIAASRGDSATAKAALKQVTDTLDRVPANILTANRQMHFLVALAHYGQGNQERAVDYLATFLRENPNDPPATKLLAKIYLERDDKTRVIALLEPLLRIQPKDPNALSLLAMAHMQDHNYRKAAELLDRATKITEDGNLRTSYGFSLMGSGNVDSGIEQLRQVFNRDPRQSRAGLMLSALQLQSGEPKRAIEVLDRMVKADPENLTALNMLGVAKAAQGDRAGARKTYEQVLAKDAGYQAAALNLARLDLVEGKTDQARQRLNRVLQSDPSNVDAMIDLSATEEKAGNTKEAVRWMEKARDEPSGAVRGAIRLSRLHLRLNSPDAAVAAAKDAVSRDAENLTSLENLARVQLAVGDRRAARETLADMARYANYNAEKQLAVANLQLAAGNPSGGAYSLEKALGTKPDWIPALALYTEIHIAQNDFAKAEQRIKTIAEKNQGSLLASRLSGDLAFARRQFPAALNHYANVQRKENSQDIAIRIFRTHVAAGEPGKGMGALEKWHREHPENLAVLRILADGHLQSNNLKAARTAYEKILASRPDDGEILNNLAQVALQQGDTGALKFAERAVAARPQDARFIDTLGWIQVRQGQVDKGLALLRDARLREAANADIRFHLAYALNRVGRKAEARDEINEAFKIGGRFEDAEQARKLQAELSR